MTVTISFERLTEAHLPLLTRWLQAPHVRVFWDDGERDEGAVRAHYFEPGRDVPGFVFRVEGREAGFIQRERITPDNEFWPWAAPEGETWGVDLLIGEPDLTGRGLGPTVIRAFLDALRAERPALRRVLIDPDPDNVRAVRAYARVGFAPLTRLATPWGEVLLMGLDVP
ncbi:aminoglycoside 6'-N-acetyltransferase [Deinococcus sp. HSC-46F16]|uniref:GNAT family N-acetyltransferase n=1 Tax=Deinococcus sp. HSC-46F16 TaxID=2910968 RepID=UPI00209F8995|nr:GNAT family N-acetyltransferase [Deinococcus sp. HSC-46F16]MCP2014122.1 aminoglycoside 6'-N-acetyltransferase [Deinococcus sp. HSC-46F16]